MNDNDLIRRGERDPQKRCIGCFHDFGTPDSAWVRKYQERGAVTPAPTLTVWYGSMPESNGKSNWTASLHRKGGSIHCDGFCFAQSEYPDRVRYEADRMRWLIGELAEKPDILAYDADLHSGYVYPPAPDPAKVQALVDAADAMLDAFCIHEDSEQIAAYEALCAALAAMKEG